MLYEGLKENEVKYRLRIYGYNTFDKKRTSDLRLLLFQFKNPFIYLLITTATLSYLLGESTDALIILFILLISGLIGFIQERSANKSVEKLLNIVRTTTTVIREGKRKEVPVEEVVPDDLVALSAGDIVPADIILLETKDFFIDESFLTGEAFPVEKQKGERAYMGSNVISGYAVGKVENTGKFTKYGHVVEKIKLGKDETDFEIGLRNIGFLLLQIASIMVFVVFAINAYFHKGVISSMLYALSVGIGIIPFLMPLMVNANLSHGARSLANSGVIIKRLTSLYNLGNMTILCMDKTGTLTHGRMEVLGFLNLMEKEDEKVKLYAYLNAFLQTGYENPIDEAIKSASNGINIEDFVKIDEVPFNFQRKRLSVMVKDRYGILTLITKGAYKNTLEVCSYAFLDGEVIDINRVREKLDNIYGKYSKQGYKVIAVAYKGITEETISYEDEKDMIFIGFVVLHDALKPQAKELIRELRNLGVDIRIITGDNVLVARKLAEDLGLQGKIISGNELRNHPAEAIPALVKETYIFAELDPMQKEDIVLALKRIGNVVGYLGDGANDLLAMRASDVAISVHNAMDVVKETADVVLTDLDLMRIERAIIIGRRAFVNSMKYPRIQISSNFGNMFSVIGASFLVPFMPLLPYQVLTLNLLADLSFLTLPLDNVDDDKVKKPTSWNLSELRKFIIFFGPISSIFDYATFFYALHVLNANPDTFRSLWFLESLITQSLVLVLLRSDKPAFVQSKPSRTLMLTILAVVSFGFLMYYTPIGKVLKLYPLTTNSLIFVLGVTVSYLFLVEILKRLYKRLNN